MARSADEPSERPSERHGPSPTQAIRPPGDAEPESDAGLEAARRRRRLVLPQLRSRAAAFHAPRRRVRSVGRGYHLGARVPRREGPGCQTQADQLCPRDRHPRKLRRPGPTLGQAREQRGAGRVPLRPVLAVGLPRQEHRAPERGGRVPPRVIGARRSRAVAPVGSSPAPRRELVQDAPVRGARLARQGARVREAQGRRVGAPSSGGGSLGGAGARVRRRRGVPAG
mmetsp:Transcript_8107/g.35809  ORF Transcript_8107/g.35809 Transcript_8107/m.35809 type:complete len:226 (-) Transcript_8107:4086-4763(-)